MMKTVKEVKATAKQLGMKGYSSINKTNMGEWIEMINVKLDEQMKADMESASEASAPIVVDQDSPTDLHDGVPFDCDCCVPATASSNLDEFFIDDAPASEASEERRQCEAMIDADLQAERRDDIVDEDDIIDIDEDKLLTIVSKDDTKVEYKVRRADGTYENVIVGWPLTGDYRYQMVIWSATRGTRRTSYAEMIRKMKPFTDKVHGDVAAIVNGLKRIAKKPGRVINAERAERGQENVSPVHRKENGNDANRRIVGKIDPRLVAIFNEVWNSLREDKVDGRVLRDCAIELNDVEDTDVIRQFVADVVGSIC